MKKVIIGLLILVLIGSGYWFFIRDDEPIATSSQSTSETTETNDAENVADIEVATGTTITYTNDGFNPGSYAVSSGGTVIIQNDSSSSLDFESNDHPTHTKNSELNVGSIAPGESRTVVLATTGSWGFHNHNNSFQTGTITVE